MLFTKTYQLHDYHRMNNFELKAWVKGVLESGISASEWTRRAGFKRPNFLYNLMAKPKSGLKHENYERLKRALDEMRAESNIKQFPNNKKNQSPFSVVEPNQISEYVPVYGATEGVIRLEKEFIVGDEMRHPGIARVNDGCAVYVEGDSMSPRREEGEVIYINPVKPPTIGRDCAIITKPNGDLLYRRYLGKTADGKSVVLKQFNPEKEFTMSLDKIRKIYSVIF